MGVVNLTAYVLYLKLSNVLLFRISLCYVLVLALSGLLLPVQLKYL